MGMKPTYEELYAENIWLKETIAVLEGKIAAQAEEIAALKSQLGKEFEKQLEAAFNRPKIKPPPKA